MKIWASAEVHIPAYANLNCTRLLVEPCLNDLLAASTLATYPYELGYIPIVMPVGMCAGYPARSKISRQDAAINCTPGFDYYIFISNDPARWLDEYLRGIAISEPLLLRAGATPENLSGFFRVTEEFKNRLFARGLAP